MTCRDPDIRALRRQAAELHRRLQVGVDLDGEGLAGVDDLLHGLRRPAHVAHRGEASHQHRLVLGNGARRDRSVTDLPEVVVAPAHHVGRAERAGEAVLTKWLGATDVGTSEV